MSETTKLSFKESVLAKRSRIILFVLNLALIIPYAVSHYSHWGVGGAAVVMALGFTLAVIRPNYSVPASREIPLLLFLDVLALLAISYQDLVQNFHLEDLDEAFVDLEGRGPILFLVAGLAIGIFVPKKQNLILVKGVGKALMGVGVIMLFWSDGDLWDTTFYYRSQYFVELFLLGCVGWNLLCVISGRLDEDVLKRNGRLGNWMLYILLAMCLAERELMQQFFLQVYRGWMDPSASLQWWKVILGAFILLGCGAAMYDYKQRSMGVDAVVMAMAASAMLLGKLLMDHYFALNWVLLIVLMVGSVKCLRNEQYGFRTMRLITPVYMGVQLAVLVALTLMLEAGLWATAVVIGVLGAVFYSGIGKIDIAQPQLRWWLTLLVTPVAIAVAYIWQARYSTETVMLLLASFLVLGLTMVILNRPHPEGLAVPREYKLLLCIFMILICLFSATRFGATAEATFDYTAETVQVKMEARGKDNQVTKVVYYWSDAAGKPVAGESVMSVYGGTIPVQGQVLNLKITDANGVVTTKTIWYPG